LFLCGLCYDRLDKNLLYNAKLFYGHQLCFAISRHIKSEPGTINQELGTWNRLILVLVEVGL